MCAHLDEFDNLMPKDLKQLHILRYSTEIPSLLFVLLALLAVHLFLLLHLITLCSLLIIHIRLRQLLPLFFDFSS